VTVLKARSSRCGALINTVVDGPKTTSSILLNPSPLHFAKMKFSLATFLLPVAVNAAEYSAQEYTSGAVHQHLMKLKTVCYTSRLCGQ
jgi:hypothetical protein